MSELPPLAQPFIHHPTITALSWSSAREVLPHEALDFTPWLADNLDLLHDVLGLDQLVLQSTEWKVETFALDILAQGSDADGDVTVVIENQYGATDHTHLGQILTYSAHAAAVGHRVLAVWITEEVRPAHLAAVEFINRIAAGDASTFGIVLLRVRFAPAPIGWHVHFEVASEPNAFLAQPVPGGGGAGSPQTMAARAAFIEAVVPLLDPVVVAAGLRRSGGINTRHGAAVYKFPATEEISKFATVRVICASEIVTVALYLERYATSAENRAVAELLRDKYQSHLETYGLRVDSWHGTKDTTKRERIITELQTGYASGDAKDVASQTADLMAAWAKMLRDHPLRGIDSAVITSLLDNEEDEALQLGEPGPSSSDAPLEVF